MPINVVCPGCKKRFAVSDKFAGQQGPCPQCKTTIEIPKLEDQVVIHAPADAGPKDSKGQAVLKPVLREETRFSVPWAVGIGAAVLVVLILAFILPPHPLVLALGALAIAPPLVLGGYQFLRNDELEPYRGQELLLRVVACGVAYAALWGIYWWLQSPWALEMSFTVTHLVYVLPPFVLAGGFAAFASLDLDYMAGLLHYGLYLLVTTALCFIMGVPLFETAS